MRGLSLEIGPHAVTGCDPVRLPLRIVADAGAGASGACDGLQTMLGKYMHKIGIETSRAKDPSDFIIGGRAKSLASAQNEHSRTWPTGTAREALNQNFAARCLHGELPASSSLSVPD